MNYEHPRPFYFLWYAGMPAIEAVWRPAMLLRANPKRGWLPPGAVLAMLPFSDFPFHTASYLSIATFFLAWREIV